MHPENLVRMPRTVTPPDDRNHDKGTDRQTMPSYPPVIHLRNAKNLRPSARGAPTGGEGPAALLGPEKHYVFGVSSVKGNNPVL